jgi:hypothetical protein
MRQAKPHAWRMGLVARQFGLVLGLVVRYGLRLSPSRDDVRIVLSAGHI